ncbi:MAG: hypothetical protein WA021_03185 [Minisyncoccia bacterium]
MRTIVGILLAFVVVVFTFVYIIPHNLELAWVRGSASQGNVQKLETKLKEKESELKIAQADDAKCIDVNERARVAADTITKLENALGEANKQLLQAKGLLKETTDALIAEKRKLRFHATALKSTTRGWEAAKTELRELRTSNEKFERTAVLSHQLYEAEVIKSKRLSADLESENSEKMTIVADRDALRERLKAAEAKVCPPLGEQPKQIQQFKAGAVPSGVSAAKVRPRAAKKRAHPVCHER